MTRGFYEQIGARPDADLDEIKVAYGRAVAHLLRRREATLAQGGDTSALDLARTQLDEAWEVLSDAARRRRYDAMLAVAGDGAGDVALDDLWSRVAGSMIHPAVSAAARIVDVATSLDLGPLPEPPRPGPDAVLTEPPLDDERAPPPRVVPGFGAPRPVSRPAVAMPAPTLRAEPTPYVEPPSLVAATAVTDAGPATTPTVSLVASPPAASATVPLSSSHDVEQLVDRLGYGGALLRTVREQHGISLQQMSETTRISARYLDAVEREDFGALPPAAAFVRGYVREMARMLGLDVERVVAGYMRRFDHDG